MGGMVNTGQQITNQQQQQLQNSTQQLTPWGPGGNVVQGLLSNLPNTGLNNLQTQGIQGLSDLVAKGNPFTGGITNTAQSLLAGGGASQFAPVQQDAYNRLLSSLSPISNPNNLNPYNTPGFSQALATTNADISDQINRQFAGAGRDLSGYNTQALARGLSQGEGGLLAGQYNQNVQNLINAGSQMFGGGTTTANNLLGFNQTGLSNQQAGIPAANSALSSTQYAPLLALQSGAQQQGIPLQNIAAEMGISLPAAQAFGTQTGQSTGYGNSQGTTTMQLPLWQQVAGGVLGTGAILGGNNGLLSAFGLGGGK